MALISILLALAIERTLPDWQQWRDWVWFDGYLQWLRDRAGTLLSADDGRSVLTVVLPVVFAVALLQYLFDDFMGGIFALLLAIGACYLTLGPRELLQEVDAYLDALATDQHDAANTHAESIIAERDLPISPDGVATAIFGESGRRFFHPLFWFALLGPVGAVLYRVNRHLLERLNQADDTDETPLLAWAQRLDYLLGWIPAHIAALSFALIGSFDQSRAVWDARDRHGDGNLHDNDLLLAEVGAAATDYGDLTSQDGSLQTVAAQTTIRRAYLLWIVAIAVLTLFGWTF
jgi:membrane protein required for beta-lactamase induction